MFSVNTPTVIDLKTALACQWLAAGETIAMVSLVGIEGRSPYPVGTQMLVNESGQYRGQLTGGCAEQAIADQAVLAMQAGENQLHRYGLGSPFFDIQLPCGSGIDVHIDVTTDLQHYQAMYKELQSRRRVTQQLTVDDKIIKLNLSPAPRIVIIGEGAILRSLAKLASLSGFESIIASTAERDINALNEAGLSARLLTDDTTFESDPFTAFVSLFHEHDREVPLLAEALSHDWFYIGALGSQPTHQSRIESLKSFGVEDTKIRSIKGPVGLNIRAETPSQIALSILADMVAHLPRYGS